MIRWIDKNIGTAAFGDPATLGLTVLDVRGLVDGPANSAESLEEQITGGLDALKAHGKLVICCDYGISRSNTMAAAILARRDETGFDHALSLVQQQTGEMRMDYGLVQAVRRLFEAAPVPSVAERVLVTGGTGFLGQWLKAVAPENFELVLTNSHDSDLLSGPYALERLVRQHRPDAIIHLANPRICQTPEVVPQALAMLRNVTDVCHGHGLFLVYASGWVVLNGMKKPGLISADDDSAACPYGNYAISKALCEQFLDFMSMTGRVRSSILRVTPVYGLGSPQPRFLYRTAEACREGRTVRTHLYRNGRPRLQLLHASDAARALLQAVSKRVAGRFNIGGDACLTTQEIAQTLARVLKTPLRHEEIQLEAEVAGIMLETAKASSVLGWRPLIDLEQGLTALFKPND